MVIPDVMGGVYAVVGAQSKDMRGIMAAPRVFCRRFVCYDLLVVNFPQMRLERLC